MKKFGDFPFIMKGVGNKVENGYKDHIFKVTIISPISSPAHNLWDTLLALNQRILDSHQGGDQFASQVE